MEIHGQRIKLLMSLQCDVLIKRLYYQPQINLVIIRLNKKKNEIILKIRIIFRFFFTVINIPNRRFWETRALHIDKRLHFALK